MKYYTILDNGKHAFDYLEIARVGILGTTLWAPGDTGTFGHRHLSIGC